MALARVLLKDPPLFVFDGFGAGLDGSTEDSLARLFRSAARGRTTIAVTHRLPSVVDFDLILVLNEGRIVEARQAPGAGGAVRRLFAAVGALGCGGGNGAGLSGQVTAPQDIREGEPRTPSQTGRRV